jgi:nucleoside-diphosphate-sugar epimerase
MAEPRPLRSVLVTGGAGFLGRAILRELAKPGPPGTHAPDGAPPLEEVRVLDLEPVEAAGPPEVESWLGDVRDADRVREACRGVDAVVHAASMIDWGRTGPGELAAVNLGGTENVLRACPLP